jgi:hypothetical protein
MVVAAGLCLGAGCLKVDAPDEIKVASDNRPPQKLDTSRVPPTDSHEEARAELAKAYEQIRYLEGQVDRYRRKYEDEKRDKKEAEQKLDRCEKRLERYEDD